MEYIFMAVKTIRIRMNTLRHAIIPILRAHGWGTCFGILILSISMLQPVNACTEQADSRLCEDFTSKLSGPPLLSEEGCTLYLQIVDTRRYLQLYDDLLGIYNSSRDEYWQLASELNYMRGEIFERALIAYYSTGLRDFPSDTDELLLYTQS